MKPLYVFLFVLVCMPMRAQQLMSPDLQLKPLPFTMFWNAKSLFNPAANGIEHKYYAALMGGQQWLGTKSSPKNIGVVMAMKCDVLHGAVGMNYVYTDFLEIHKLHSFDANYSYHFKLGNERVLSAGISGGLTLDKYEFSMEPPIEDQKGTEKYYNINLGLYYQSNHLRLGLSSDHYEYTDIFSAEKEIYGIIYLYSSYRFVIGENLDISPEILLSSFKLYNRSTNLTSGLLLTYKEKFWTGFTYRTDNTYGGMAGFNIAGTVKIGYSCEIRTKVDGFKNYGNHELVMALMIK
jgi:type IX secretion system PorP/SprF family membrane protein